MSRIPRAWGLPAAMLIAMSGPALAYASLGSNVVTTDHVTAQLIPESAALVPGRPGAIALRLVASPHWHTYWRNPGDSGLPTSLHWRLPDHARAGEIQWPTPERLSLGPLVNFGYEGEVWLITDIQLPADYALPHATIFAMGKWLVCKDICIPEIGEFALSLPVAGAAPPPPNIEATRGFSAARKQLPTTGADWHPSASPMAVGARLTVRSPLATEPFTAAYYFPYDEGLVEPAVPQVLTALGNDGYALDIPRARQPAGSLDRLRGVLAFETAARERRSIEIDVPMTAAVTAEMRADPSTDVAPGPATSARASALAWTALLLAGASAIFFVLRQGADPR